MWEKEKITSILYTEGHTDTGKHRSTDRAHSSIPTESIRFAGGIDSPKEKRCYHAFLQNQLPSFRHIFSENQYFFLFPTFLTFQSHISQIPQFGAHLICCLQNFFVCKSTGECKTILSAYTI